MIRSHRFSLELSIGRELTSEEEACHECDNPICCNPKHLFVGSHDDNMKDMASKHYSKGERHSRAKLSSIEYKKALELRKSGWKVKDIAELFSLDRGHTSRLLRGLTGHQTIHEQGNPDD